MQKILLYIGCVLLSCVVSAQSLDDLKKQKEEAEKAISFTNKLLDANKKSKDVSVNKLTLISKQINSRQKLISTISAEVSLLDRSLADKKEKITKLSKEIELLKEEYAKSVYHTWKTKNTNNRLMYVFSGKDLGEVYRRVRYLREFTSYRQRQGEVLLVKKDELAEQIVILESTKKEKVKLVERKATEQHKLQTEKKEQDKYVVGLKQKEKKLKKQLAQHKRKMRDLNRFIEKVIADEIKKARDSEDKTKMKLTPEEKLLSTNFDKNKGRLPWPLKEGVITSKFGVYTNPQYKYVKEENFGIDIQTLKGGEARAVFKGEVTGVYAVPGLNQVIIVRHGDYRTTYSNIEIAYVKRGDIVKTKQALGKIFTDDANQKTNLHFQVWKGIVKLNPELWITK